MRSLYLRKYHKIKNNVDIGFYSYGGCFSCSFNLGGKVSIGRYCSIGNNVQYLSGNHPYNTVSTSPLFYNKEFGFTDVKDIKRNSLEIGNDVWIGQNVMITSSCHSIGNGAIIGAGAIVTKDVEPYSIVAGNPAKKIKDRFSKSECQMIEQSKWWTLQPEEIHLLYPYFEDIKSFTCLLKENVH